MIQIFMDFCPIDHNVKICLVMWVIIKVKMKNINFLDHPYWIPKCLNVGRISMPLQIFSYIYFPQIFIEIGWMFENVKIPIDHHVIFLFCPFQNLLILSHLSESVDVPAG